MKYYFIDFVSLKPILALKACAVSDGYWRRKPIYRSLYGSLKFRSWWNLCPSTEPASDLIALKWIQFGIRPKWNSAFHRKWMLMNGNFVPGENVARIILLGSNKIFSVFYTKCRISLLFHRTWKYYLFYRNNPVISEKFDSINLFMHGT